VKLVPKLPHHRLPHRRAAPAHTRRLRRRSYSSPPRSGSRGPRRDARAWSALLAIGAEVGDGVPRSLRCRQDSSPITFSVSFRRVVQTRCTFRSRCESPERGRCVPAGSGGGRNTIRTQESQARAPRFSGRSWRRVGRSDFVADDPRRGGSLLRSPVAPGISFSNRAATYSKV
jgi:hypothetical protein